MEWAHFNVSSHGTCKHKMQHRMETRESDWERERVNIWMYYFPTLTNTCSTIQPPMRQYQQARATCAPTYSGEIPRNENTIFSAHSLHLLRSNGHEWAWNCKRMRRRQPAAHIRAIFQSRRTMFIYMLRNVPVLWKDYYVFSSVLYFVRWHNTEDTWNEHAACRFASSDKYELPQFANANTLRCYETQVQFACHDISRYVFFLPFLLSLCCQEKQNELWFVLVSFSLHSRITAHTMADPRHCHCLAVTNSKVSNSFQMNITKMNG